VTTTSADVEADSLVQPNAFAVHPASIAVYHLGNSGTARTLLKAWMLVGMPSPAIASLWTQL
jgi:hypothetical protein